MRLKRFYLNLVDKDGKIFDQMLIQKDEILNIQIDTRNDVARIYYIGSAEDK